MHGDKKALRLFLNTGEGRKVTAKKLNDAVGWDFRKYVSNLRKQGVDISHSNKSESGAAGQNFYVMNRMPDEDTILAILNKGSAEKVNPMVISDFQSFSSMFP